PRSGFVRLTTDDETQGGAGFEADNTRRSRRMAWPFPLTTTALRWNRIEQRRPRSLRGRSHLLLECATIPCMTISYLPYHPDQAHLLPVSASDWLPEGHLAYFIADTVESLDLSAFHARYAKGGP